ncbi:hypothetical protein SEA_HFRANCETTE_24 [Streptomyces phage HFrancette]|uniref:Uncharacterized protein n=2 Tax=Ignaciovirus TaxID=3152509 RepID=A0A9E7NIA5_9CAUD|nr:hypothetical protein QEN60_gp24 [Streptomyces phage Ignacio]YP_010756375.1 hypothetical protein QEN64_gp24 [Streptomyces phage HFrancette]QKN87551.1 hypothetical protein SEA_IGNACIO_24 [Streptomyces phage Ignacio]UTN92119.1 hypothetical protein SEA_HFRANCETTE_24 [Streptomyces phage HFrancette]
MNEMNRPAQYEPCGVRGQMADADAITLMNLAHTGCIVSWDIQHLECELPMGHDDDETSHHVQHLVPQDFSAAGHQNVDWWASWIDKDDLRNNAAVFVAPMCDATLCTPGQPPESGWVCTLLAGHESEGVQRHNWE